MARQPIFMVSVLGAALLLPVGLASAQAKPPEPVAIEDGKSAVERVLAPKYKVEIDVAGRGGFKGAAEVQEDGLIFLPYGDAIRAEGRTPNALADQIAKLIKEGGFVAEPVVTVKIFEVEASNEHEH